VDRGERRQQVIEQVHALAEEAGGVVPDDEGLVDEVTDLVEAPRALVGSFDTGHLALPQEVLVTVMRKHQRYFAVVTPDTGELMPLFITVCNGTPPDPDVVTRGNEGVVRARYADAAFFHREDSRKSLDEYLPRLDTLTFQEDLGSVLAKTKRIQRLVASLSAALGLADSDTRAAVRAAELCKADLATSMVVEMTSLQGTMGRHYARASGEPEEVSQAIEEHYRPRFPGDGLPQSRAGFAVSVCDRLDSLAGLFCAGVKPRATADPYGLRRDALGLLANLIGFRCRLSLREALESAASGLPEGVNAGGLDDAFEFILRRLEVQLRDEGYGHDVVQAAATSGCDDPYEIRRAVVGLAGMVAEENWLETLHAYSRCKRIVRELDVEYALDVTADDEPATHALHRAYEHAASRMAETDDRIGTLAATLRDLREPIDTFFEKVLVMAEEPELRESRLGLVQHVAAIPDGIADLSCLEGF